VRKTDGNPEGKGLSTFLMDRHRTEPRGIVAKPARQLIADLFASMLVLSARFKFPPVAGKTYYLYYLDYDFSLSLIGPAEWSNEKRRNFVASCTLRTDMTWTIAPSAELSDNDQGSEAIGRYYDAFVATLDTNLAIEEILPFYVPNLSYYQRLYASALSRSLYMSLALGNHKAVTGRQWHRLLSASDSRNARLRVSAVST
jgi:hypothetical protein